MEKSKTVESKIHSEVFFATLLTILSLTSCGSGGSGVNTQNSTGSRTTPPQPNISTIASVDAASVITPYIAGNAVQYYCDCTGPKQSCVAAGSTQGNDTTGTGTLASPYQTLDKGMTWVTGGVNRTLALCQGGSFTTANAGATKYALTGNSCPEGTICNEVREYPVNGPGAKPLITNNTLATPNTLFETDQNVTNGGWRFMNIKLQGFYDAASQGNEAFLFYNWATGTYTHDILIENLDIDGFDKAINDSGDATLPISNNETFTGNHFTNVSSQGFLGGNNNLIVSYNSFVNSANNTGFSHDIYIGTHLNPISNVQIIGNYATGYSNAFNATQCVGTVFQSHAAITNFTVSGNVVIEGSTAGAGCYGFEFSNVTTAVGPIYLRNALFSDNIVVNGGAASFIVDNCPYCVIENNLAIKDSANFGGAGIASPADAARPSHGDDVETNATIVNNTIYFGVGTVTGMQGGIRVSQEGTGYIVANNTVMYAPTIDGGNQVNCYGYWLPTSSYLFVNNNNCYSNDTAVQWASNNVTQYTMAAWQTASGFDASSSYSSPRWTSPLTIPAWSDSTTGATLFAPYFTPSGSPLVGAGSHAFGTGSNTTYAPTTDITSTTTRSNPPSIGAYE